ncbi:MAG: hypothetical protein EBQ96_08640 [Proteobacteria bacterium]|nr:hypothetical protein [Pseudomonadota bacterium]
MDKFQPLDVQEIKLADRVVVKIQYFLNNELNVYQFVGHIAINTSSSFTSEKFVSEELYTSRDYAEAAALKKVDELKVKYNIK